MKAVWFGLVLSAISAAGKVSYGKQGQKATIECGVDTYRDSVAWHHGTKPIIRERKNRLPVRGDSEIVSRAAVRGMTNLEIRKLKETDAGKFKCEIDGKYYEHVLLVVSVSVAPGSLLHKGKKATLQCKVAGPADDLTVQWKRPDGSAASSSDTVTLQAAALSDAGKWACVFSSSGQVFNATLDIVVEESKTTTPQPRHSQGSIPKSPCDNCFDVSSSSDPTTSAPLFPWWVWAVAGVGCLLVVILLVLIIVLVQRIRRKKRRFLKMKQARQMAPRQYCQCPRPAAAAKPQKGRRRERPAALPAQPLLME